MSSSTAVERCDPMKSHGQRVLPTSSGIRFSLNDVDFISQEKEVKQKGEEPYGSRDPDICSGSDTYPKIHLSRRRHENHKLSFLEGVVSCQDRVDLIVDLKRSVYSNAT
jgi:hypothetical protein